MSEHSGQSMGPATDRKNDPVIDPTANVLNLVEAAIRRMDDLLQAGLRRQDDLRNKESDHLREIVGLRADMAGLRAAHARELREAEAARIDAIRAVDVGQVQRAAEVQADQATALASQVALSAETLRNTVAAAAAAAATALNTALDPIQKAIDDLRRAQYEQQGQKAQVVESQARGGSVGLWVGAGIAFFGVVIAAVALIAVLATQGGTP